MKKIKPKKKKETTLDDLALMVQGGFKEVDKKFEEVYERFDGIDKRLDIIELKLIARHDRELEQLRDRILQIETKLSKL